MSSPASVAVAEMALKRRLPEVNEAAAAFERRWTMAALRRVDPDLAQRLAEQRSLWDEASAIGSATAIDVHGPATVRGWQAACRAMEAAAEPPDAFLIGRCYKTGFTVAIGPCHAYPPNLDHIAGQEVTLLTPDEVATILAGLDGVRAIASIKATFPGATVEEVRDAPAA